jgi:hypothetical protein
MGLVAAAIRHANPSLSAEEIGSRWISTSRQEPAGV